MPEVESFFFASLLPSRSFARESWLYEIRPLEYVCALSSHFPLTTR